MYKIYENERVHDLVIEVVLLDGSVESHPVVRTEKYWTIECRKCGAKRVRRGRLVEHVSIETAMYTFTHMEDKECNCEVDDA